jgi:hypothetical protein
MKAKIRTWAARPKDLATCVGRALRRRSEGRTDDCAYVCTAGVRVKEREIVAEKPSRTCAGASHYAVQLCAEPRLGVPKVGIEQAGMRDGKRRK